MNLPLGMHSTPESQVQIYVERGKNSFLKRAELFQLTSVLYNDRNETEKFQFMQKQRREKNQLVSVYLSGCGAGFSGYWSCVLNCVHNDEYREHGGEV